MMVNAPNSNIQYIMNNWNFYNALTTRCLLVENKQADSCRRFEAVVCCAIATRFAPLDVLA